MLWWMCNNIKTNKVRNEDTKVGITPIKEKI